MKIERKPVKNSTETKVIKAKKNFNDLKSSKPETKIIDLTEKSLFQMDNDFFKVLADAMKEECNLGNTEQSSLRILYNGEQYSLNFYNIFGVSDLDDLGIYLSECSKDKFLNSFSVSTSEYTCGIVEIGGFSSTNTKNSLYLNQLKKAFLIYLNIFYYTNVNEHSQITTTFVDKEHSEIIKFLINEFPPSTIINWKNLKSGNNLTTFIWV